MISRTNRSSFAEMPAIRITGFPYHWYYKGMLNATYNVLGRARLSQRGLIGSLRSPGKSACHQLASAADFPTYRLQSVSWLVGKLADRTYRLVISREILPTHSSITKWACKIQHLYIWYEFRRFLMPQLTSILVFFTAGLSRQQRSSWFSERVLSCTPKLVPNDI